MQKINIDLGNRSYPILIGSNLLKPDIFSPFCNGGQVLIVSNETVAPLYLEQTKAAMAGSDPDTLVLPDGESWKTLSTWENILNKLTETGATRDCTLVALGGGVIGDMVGFAAASYMRGVRFIQIPTTLLSQVDASVGGKTGVNLPAGKNLVGAFHQPVAVVIDTDSLNTLPQREYLAGLAEVVKYGLIRDRDFFNWLASNMDRLLQRDSDALATAIRRSCENKAEVVIADEREQGQRALLNLGHTFGHALETATGYNRYLHGEAVSVGMCLAAKCSEHFADAESGIYQLTCDLLHGLGLPVELPDDITPLELTKLMMLDKKNLKDTLRLVLMKDVGSAYIESQLSAKQIQTFLEQLRRA